MFVTIITFFLITIALTLWAIVYGGSKYISKTEQEFNKQDEILFIDNWQVEQQEKYNRKLLKKILKKLNRKN